MNKLNVAVIRWHLTQLLMRISLPTLIAALLLLFVLFSYWFKVLPMLDTLHDNQVQLLQLEKQRLLRTPVEKSTAPLTIKAQLAQFYQRFPHPKSLPDLLAQINDEAMAHRLTLDKGDYNLKRLKSKKANASDAHLTQYEITLPIEGNYGDIRAFMNNLLSNMPMLAITDVQMVRETIKSRQVEARIRLVLFFNEQTQVGA